MKKYILLASAAFLLACLIGGGTIRQLERKGKIRLEWSPTATAIKTRSIDRIIRELIPDSGQIYGKWEVLAHQEDPVEWEYVEGHDIEPRFGKVQLVWNDGRPIPDDWNILLNGFYYEGYKSFGISHDSIFDIAPGGLPIQLQEGEEVELIPIEKDRQLPFVNKKAHYELYSVRLNGKAPAQLLVEWPGENNGHTLSIYGEAANTEKLWASYDDLFSYHQFGNFTMPYFFEVFDRWLRNSMEVYTNWCKYYIGHELFCDICTNFIIEKDGSITDINSHHSLSHLEAFANSPIVKAYIKEFNRQILKSAEKWEPVKIQGKPIRIRLDYRDGDWL